VNFMPQSIGQTGAAEALLASYALGSLSPPLHALVASHLVLRPESRGFVASMEGLAAQALGEGVAEPGIADRGKRLAAIFAQQDAPQPMAAPDGVIPAPLSAYLGRSFDSLQWKSVLPGLREVKIEDRDGCEASLLWIKAGRAMPSHTHHGMEATLVLRGSFEDALGHYARGDIAVADSDVDHKPVAGLGEDCICFAVSEGPVRLTGPVARLFMKLLGH
jgi:putative transcriptional regulator